MDDIDQLNPDMLDESLDGEMDELGGDEHDFSDESDDEETGFEDDDSDEDEE